MQFTSRFGSGWALAAAAAMALAGPAWGQADSTGTFKTGEELYEVCTSSDENDLARCEWYIMGVHDAVILHQDVEWVERTICPPDALTAEELREKVVGYLRESEDRNFTAVSMVYNTFEATWACGA